MEQNGLKIRLHGNFALQNGEISTLCGTIEAFRASIRLAETLSIEGLEVLRDYVKERGMAMSGPDKDLRISFAAYIDHMIRDAKRRDRSLRSGHPRGWRASPACPPLRDREFADSLLEGTGFELLVRGRVKLVVERRRQRN